MMINPITPTNIPWRKVNLRRKGEARNIPPENVECLFFFPPAHRKDSKCGIFIGHIPDGSPTFNGAYFVSDGGFSIRMLKSDVIWCPLSELDEVMEKLEVF